MPTDTFTREGFSDLSPAELGVLVRAMIGLSVPKSYDIGYFTDKATDEPWTRAHIVKQIRPTDGDPQRHDAEAFRALQRFLDMEPPLAHEDAVNGYFFDPDLFEPWLHENNRIAKREADACRKRRSRAAQAANEKAPGKTRTAKKPIPLRAAAMRSQTGD